MATNGVCLSKPIILYLKAPTTLYYLDINSYCNLIQLDGCAYRIFFGTIN